MRFSTVVAVSAVTLASSAVAVPVMDYDYEIATRNNDEAMLQLRGLFDDDEDLLSREVTNPSNTNATITTATPTSTSAPKPKKTKTAKKLFNFRKKKSTPEQKATKDLSAARKAFDKAQTRLKKAEATLATARNAQGNSKADNKVQTPSADMAKKIESSKRSLDIEELLEDLAARGLFDEEELFERALTTPPPSPPPTPAATTSPAAKATASASVSPNSTPTNSANAKSKASHKQKKPLRKARKGKNAEKDLAAARLRFEKAQAALKKAEANMVNAKSQGQGAKAAVSASGVGAVKPMESTKSSTQKREVDELMEIIARGYYGDFDEEF